MNYQSTKIIELGSTAFRQWRAEHSHCKFIHGYKLVAKFWFSCNSLDDKNWVVDFGGLKDLKKLLEHQFDHTLCVAADDPLLSYFKQLNDLGAANLRVMEKGVGIERTAEWCFDVADSHIRGITNNRCWVEKVEVWEHDKNSAVVSYARENEFTSTNVVVKQNHVTTGNSETISTTIQPNISEVSNVVNAGVNLDQSAAPLYCEKSKGFSNPFQGTSWGV